MLLDRNPAHDAARLHDLLADLARRAIVNGDADEAAYCARAAAHLASVMQLNGDETFDDRKALAIWLDRLQALVNETSADRATQTWQYDVRAAVVQIRRLIATRI